MTDDSKIVVLVCSKCHKLIGTRENYWVNDKSKKIICEGCYHVIE